MKIAYSFTWPVGLNDGHTKKFMWNTDIWRKLGHDVKIFGIDTTGPEHTTEIQGTIYKRAERNSLLGRYQESEILLKKLAAEIRNFNPDILYLQHQYYKNTLVKLMTEYPTILELNGDDTKMPVIKSLFDWKNIIHRSIHIATRRKMLSKAVAFVGVTSEQEHLAAFKPFNKLFHCSPNAVPLSEYEILESTPERVLPKVALIYSSPHYNYHGWDKILYLAEKTKNILNFVLIGPKPNFDLKPNMECTGFIPRAQYQKVLATCDVGLGPLSFYKDGAIVASAIKTRECLAYGLPVIIGYQDDPLSGKELPWVLQLPSSDDNVSSNITKIIEFCQKSKGKRVPHSQTEQYIGLKKIEEAKLNFITNFLMSYRDL
jgi:hypothetical protein